MNKKRNDFFPIINVHFQLEYYTVQSGVAKNSTKFQFVRIYANYSWHVFQCLRTMVNEKHIQIVYYGKYISNYGNCLRSAWAYWLHFGKV